MSHSADTSNIQAARIVDLVLLRDLGEMGYKIGQYISGAEEAEGYGMTTNLCDACVTARRVKYDKGDNVAAHWQRHKRSVWLCHSLPEQDLHVASLLRCDGPDVALNQVPR